MKSKEQREYELADRYLELRDGVVWRKEYIDRRSYHRPAKPAKGSVICRDYIQIRVDGKLLLKHRVVYMLAHKRPIREGYVIHHDNGNQQDNRIENLIEVTQRVNCQNRRQHIGGNFFGGHETSYGYDAQIQVNGKQHYLGSFKTPEQTLIQYKKAERFAELNPELLPHLTPAMLRNFINAE